ncbi:MAG: hypothetical protein E7396_09415 [Ruminococcaceae bacterium]|nr:hypothetical protein [Oscillospiraceae bacterium]
MLKKIIKKLLSPVYWFWDKYEQYKEEDCIWKILLLFALSLGGLTAIAYVLIWVVSYVITYHPEWFLIGGLIVWLYASVKTKTKKKSVEPMAPQTATIDYDLLSQKAFARKDIIINIMYKCFREVATKLGCNIPIREEEIYMENNWYRYGDNFVIFLFRLEKKDMKAPWNIELRNEYTIVVESKLQHMISSNMFKGIGYPVARDKFGDTLRRIYVFDITDEGQYLYIYVVFGCPEYQEYLNRTSPQTITPLDESVPDATWDEFNF